MCNKNGQNNNTFSQELLLEELIFFIKDLKTGSGNGENELSCHGTKSVACFRVFIFSIVWFIGDCELIFPVKVSLYLMGYHRLGFLNKFFYCNLFNYPAM